MSQSFSKIKFINFNALYKPKQLNKSNKFTVIQQTSDLSELSQKNSYIEDTVFTYPLSEYLKQIKRDMGSMNSIWKQFELDLPRSKIFINDVQIKEPILVLDYFMCEYNIQLGYDVILLCTQACLGLPCEILFNIYRHNELYIAEPSNRNSLTIRIEVKDDKINYNIRKQMRLIDSNGNTKSLINIHVEFDLLNDDLIYIHYIVE